MRSLSINGREQAVASGAEAADLLAGAESMVEAWARHGSAAMCGLVAGDVGWLMLIRHEGDAGLRSHSPAAPRPGDAELRFVLANGQADVYPAAWTYPRAAVLSALAHFAETGLPDPAIAWREA